MKNRVVIKSILFIVVLTLLNPLFAQNELTIHSPNYFEEKNNVYDDIHYLENEMLSFTMCTKENAKNVSAKLLCSTKNDKNIELFQKAKKKGYDNVRVQKGWTKLKKELEAF